MKASPVLPLLATGAASTRKNYLSWARLEPTESDPENYYWELYDEELAAAGSAGLRTILVVADSPAWAAPTSCGPIAAESLPAFGDFLFALVSRYARDPYRIKDYELFNEPDGTEPWYGATINCWGRHGDRYAEMLRTAYPAIKSADPESRVILGGLACDWFTDEGGIFQREFLADVLAHGGGGYFDVLNFHYYYFHIDTWAPYGRDVIGKVNYLGGVLASGGTSKPMICTEVGIWGYDGPEPPDLQASYVPRVNVRGLAAGLETVLWYPLVDGFTPFHGGLVEEWGSLKPAFSAYTTLVAELDGYIYGWTLSPAETGSPAIEGYGFASRFTGKAKRVLWADQTTVMSFPFSRIRVVDRRGPERFVSDGGEGDGDPAAGSIQIPISPQPVYVEEWD